MVHELSSRNGKSKMVFFDLRTKVKVTDDLSLQRPQLAPLACPISKH